MIDGDDGIVPVCGLPVPGYLCSLPCCLLLHVPAPEPVVLLAFEPRGGICQLCLDLLLASTVSMAHGLNRGRGYQLDFITIQYMFFSLNHELIESIHVSLTGSGWRP